MVMFMRCFCMVICPTARILQQQVKQHQLVDHMKKRARAVWSAPLRSHRRRRQLPAGSQRKLGAFVAPSRGGVTPDAALLRRGCCWSQSRARRASLTDRCRIPTARLPKRLRLQGGCPTGCAPLDEQQGPIFQGEQRHASGVVTNGRWQHGERHACAWSRL